MPLLAPDVTRIGRPDSEPYEDRAPEWVAEGTPEPLRSDLTSLLGDDRVLTRAIDIVRFASDASPYRKFPRAVVMSRDTDDVSKTFAYARANGIPVTFRGGGTSLNGQGQTDGLLVDARRHWNGVTVEDDAERVRVRPGTILGHVNRVLAPHRRRLGPDPASTDIATVGGVIANNSGGMRCGVTYDSYQTVAAMKFVLPSGTVIDTESADAEERFAQAEPELARGLIELRDEIRGDSELAERIRRKFQIKNTTGYRLCAFLDADTPVQIFRRLLVGSEGTLAFVAEAVFETRPMPAVTTVSWLHFPSIDAASAPVGQLVEAGATAVELMVAPALMVASHNIRGTPESWRELPPESAALLVEFGAETTEELDERQARAEEILAEAELIQDADFTRDSERIELNWRVREAMHGLVGRLRPPGTALIVEDVCVPPARVAEAAKDLQALLGEHGFLTGVAGHVSAGNWHFMLTPNFAEAEDRERYETFIGKLVDLVIDGYDGSLKAEHGTGVNMAPFVEKEWGERATELMWRIKELADPGGVLSPGVVLNRDPDVHMQHLHSTPPIEEEATACVECGFCEPVCPSRNVTTTPRQRIVIRREMARQPEGSPVLDSLLREYEYDGIQTCAADGSCGPACPVAIDTGKLIKRFRAAERTDRAESMGAQAARHWATVEKNARGGLRSGGLTSRVIGDRGVRFASAGLRQMLGEELIPAWSEEMPRAAPPALPSTGRAGAAAVYMPACINRIFGNGRDAPARPTLPEAMVAVSDRAELPLWIPDDAAGHCCATPWASKGYQRGNQLMARKVADAMWRWTDGGELPLVIDASSCALGLRDEIAPHLSDEERERYERLEVIDSIEWAHDRLLGKLDVRRKVGTVAIHPTCSARELELIAKLATVAGELAEHVVLPPGSSCCGFAGDRGFLHPELPASALREEAAELDGRDLDACLCSNRTCEIGLQEVTGRPFASFVFLLEELTRP